MYYTLFYETLFVGIYSLILYSILQRFIRADFIYVLFLLGIIKHSLGYLLGLQTYYCKLYKGNESIAVLPTGNDIFMEGILYISVGMTLLVFVKNKYLIAFFIGIILHILSEFIGIHAIFLQYRCSNFSHSILSA